jgi:hypothetical protein
MIFHRKMLPPLILGFAVTLAGCATNALRIEYAQTVVDKGKAATAASRTFIDQVDQGREELEIELIAADPLCGRTAGQAFVRAQPILGARAPAAGWLCAWSDRYGSYTLARGRRDDRIRDSIGLIDAITAYTTALAEVLDEEIRDPAETFSNALATGLAVQNTIVAATGGEGPLPAADDARVEAVRGFISFVGTLATEAHRVRGLRAALEHYPQGAQPLIEALRNDLWAWERRRAGQANAMQRINDLLLNGILQRSSLTVAQRREALRANYDRAAKNRAGALLHPALLDLLETFEKADRDFRRIIVDDPELNDRENRRVVELTRQRIVQGLERLTALVNAFRGA